MTLPVGTNKNVADMMTKRVAVSKLRDFIKAMFGAS